MKSPKPQFHPGDPVQSETSAGRVVNVSPFPDHVEYLVEFPDGTASWIHEAALRPVATSPATS